MRIAKVGGIDHLRCMPDRDCDQPVFLVRTNLPAGQVNCFYMDIVDLHGVPVPIGSMDPRSTVPSDPGHIAIGDYVLFDKQDGIHKVVVWKDLRIRQRGYSFDNYHQGRNGL